MTTQATSSRRRDRRRGARQLTIVERTSQVQLNLIAARGVLDRHFSWD
ncbi:MAG: hypothetical protein WAV54_08880 [Acidimicrobiales bacterium]|jgi:hypothetical protein